MGDLLPYTAGQVRALNLSDNEVKVEQQKKKCTWKRANSDDAVLENWCR
jgi:hypothetical protein